MKVLNNKVHFKQKMRLGLILLLLLITPSMALASVSLGVSPGVLNYDKVLKGGYAERTITISTSKVDPVITAIEFDEDQEINSWISIRPNSTNFTIAKGNAHELTLIIQPPANAENGNYSGIMHVRTQKLANLGGVAFGSAIKADVSVRINIEVTGQQIASCYVGGLDVRDTESGFPIDVYATLANDGNVVLTPLFEVFIWDKLKQELLLTKSNEEFTLFPTLTDRVYFGIENSLEPGQYWITVKVPECGFNLMKTFDIVEEGGISDKGELVSINAETWAEVNELIPIIAVFKNTGVRPEDVYVKLEIKLGKQLIDTFQTETLRVLEGDTQEFKQYFTPEEAGRYEVRGIAYYNKKVSFEKGSVINVKPRPSERPNYWIWGIYAIMLIIIVIMLRKIAKARR